MELSHCIITSIISSFNHPWYIKSHVLNIKNVFPNRKATGKSETAVTRVSCCRPVSEEITHIVVDSQVEIVMSTTCQGENESQTVRNKNR